MQFAFQTSSVDQQIGPVSLTENSSTGFEILMGKLSQKNKVLDALSKHEFLICWPVHCGVAVGQMHLRLFFCQHP